MQRFVLGRRDERFSISRAEPPHAVGSDSIGAFTVAFTAYTGSTPGSFGRRHTKTGRVFPWDMHDGQSTAGFPIMDRVADRTLNLMISPHRRGVQGPACRVEGDEEF